MNYTAEHYEMLKLLEAGIVFDDLTEEQKCSYRFLDGEGLIQPRADILDGYCVLSERGKCVLAERRQKNLTAEIETRRKIQELRNKEEEKRLARWERQQKELQKAQKIARDEAKQERQQRFENKIAIANLLIPLITYILGILTEHYAGIIDFFLQLFN